MVCIKSSLKGNFCIFSLKADVCESTCAFLELQKWRVLKIFLLEFL